MKKLLIIGVIFSFFCNSYSQKLDTTRVLNDSNSIKIPKDKNHIIIIDGVRVNPPTQYKLHPVRLALVGGAMAGVFTGLHIYYSNTWWKDQKNYFKFAE